MLTLFLTALRYKIYVALALFTWGQIYSGHLPKEAPGTADAIAWAVLMGARELPKDLRDERLVATMAVYSARESDVQSRPCARRKDSGCGDHGLAGGLWQLHQPAGWKTPRDQAEAWVELVRQAARMCGSSTGGLAMTLSGHCDQGLRSTQLRLQTVETVLQAWNASEIRAAFETATPATVEETAAAVPAAAESSAASRSANGEGDRSVRQERVPAVRAFF